MPAISDFRTTAFDFGRVKASGRNVGANVYWKLYAIENVIRVIVHSVLSAQIGSDWWSTAVDSRIQGKVQRFRNTYGARPWHSSPGKHEIYYIDLSDLNEIMRANSNLFVPVVPDVDQWIARLEQVRLPRNIVAHMNWLHQTDRLRIEVTYEDIQILADQLAGSLALLIP